MRAGVRGPNNPNSHTIFVYFGIQSSFGAGFSCKFLISLNVINYNLLKTFRYLNKFCQRFFFFMRANQKGNFFSLQKILHINIHRKLHTIHD